MAVLTKEQYKEIKASFRSMDANGDGRLSIKEFTDAAKKMGQDITTKQVKEMFKLVDDNEIKASFRSMDANGDGRLSIKEFTDAAKKMGQDVTTKQVKEMFKLVDDNGDGYLSYKEYEKMMVEQLESQIVEHQFLEKCFSKMDVNKDGTISAVEIAKTMNISREEADELVREGDTDGDGQLTFEEFVSVYRS